MKVVVTGGAGFIGANVCRELLRRPGYEVVVLDNLSTGKQANLAGLDVELRTGSVLDPRAVAGACAGADSIVHLAAAPAGSRSADHPRAGQDPNVTGTLTVLDAAREIGAHVVVASSSSVYGRNPVLPRTEDLACLPNCPDAAGKLAVESYVAAYQSSFGLASCVFRLFNVFGPLQVPNHPDAGVVPSFVFNALHGMPLVIHGDGAQSRDFTFVGTVAEILAEAVVVRTTRALPVNLAYGTPATVNEVVTALSELLGRRPEVRHRPPRPGDVKHSQAAPGALSALFPQIRPVTFPHGLLRTISWMESRFVSVPGTEVPA
ncbi:MAG TPA: NAD-dependent epimerase/dehydratase family protein [Amycolatopsis sp.]|uniref:NAD-dependent epimerase/dehydratase family protein n=1 Tax=Amycolatopsis sp. TaxID=37632 RepID=UPI002B45AFDE|nr:NAD-dependent epimerase/dehydratase family protein [Amycolatopsis sp.]HKS46875.1 NAD-dependent epimerase/dehydratase family protein [Amycolatopsis sp.]